jgi:hypothetical protein
MTSIYCSCCFLHNHVGQIIKLSMQCIVMNIKKIKIHKIKNSVTVSLAKPEWKISESKIKTKSFKDFFCIGKTKTLSKSKNFNEFTLKNSTEKSNRFENWKFPIGLG